MEFPKRYVVQIPPVSTPGIIDSPNAPYGYAPDQYNNAAAPPPTYKDDSNDHCNILPPAPRSQIYPPKCGNLKSPFKKGELYLTYSPTQGTMGFTQGRSNNGNWIRGNEFADNYNQKQFANAHLHSKEIDVGKVLQSNPIYVANSPFYKRTSPGCSSCSAYEQQKCEGCLSGKKCIPDSQNTFCTRKNKWNLTYPHSVDFDQSGQPIFYSDPAQQPTYYIGPNNNVVNGVKIIEGFNPMDFDSGSTHLMVILWTIIIIVVFIVMVTLRNRN